MIGSWNDSGVEVGFAPNALSRGNWLVDQNTGNEPSYNGIYQNCVYTNMGVGSGFIYNGGNGYRNYDGGNDQLILNKKFLWSNANIRTIQNKINLQSDATSSQIFSQRVDVNTYVICFVDGATRTIRFFARNAGGPGIQIISTNTISDGDHSIDIIKDGATVRIGLDGVEVAYDNQDPWNIGTMTPNQNFIFGNNNQAIGGWTYRMYWNFIYTEAFTFARSLTDHNLGNDMGLIGTKVGDSFSLAAPGNWPLLNQRNELAYNGAQLR